MFSSEENILALVEETIKGGRKYWNKEKQFEGNRALNDILAREFQVKFTEKGEEAINKALLIDEIYTQGETRGLSMPSFQVFYDKEEAAESFTTDYYYYCILRLEPSTLAGGNSQTIIACYRSAIKEYLLNIGWDEVRSEMVALRNPGGSISDMRDQGIVFYITKFSL